MTTKTIEQLRAAAKTLRAQSAEQGIRITHSTALHTIARQHGFETWNAARAILQAPPPPPPPPFTKEDGVSLIDALAERQKGLFWSLMSPAERHVVYADADVVIEQIAKAPMPRLEIALVRYAVMHLRLKVNTNLPAFVSFRERYYDLIRGRDPWGVNDPFREYFPELVEPERGVIAYEEIVLTMDALLSKRIDITADEMVEHFRLDGRDFAPGVVHGLMKKGMSRIRSEANHFHRRKQHPNSA